MSMEDDANNRPGGLAGAAGASVAKATVGVREQLGKEFAHRLDETVELMVASATRVAKAKGADAVRTIQIGAEINVGVGSLSVNMSFDGQQLRRDETVTVDKVTLNKEASDVHW